ncbi:MAG: hypothetical protein AAB354_00255 [candidate division KSB1 bacterium]
MAKSLKSSLAKFMVAGMLTTMALSACSKHPNETQLKALQDCQNATQAAQAMVTEKQRTREQAKSRVAQKRADLQKAQAEKAAVAKRLGM